MNERPEFLEDVPEEKWAEFSRRVKAAEGKAIILVHPYWGAAPEAYSRTIARILSQTRTPVIILEETGKTDERYAGHLLLPTVMDQSMLNTAAIKTETERDAELVRRLTGAGVNTVLVGGMNAAIPYDSNNYRTLSELESLRFNGNPARQRARETDFPVGAACAGSLYRRLVFSKSFERVRWIPGAMHPQKPSYFKDNPKIRPVELKRAAPR